MDMSDLTDNERRFLRFTLEEIIEDRMLSEDGWTEDDWSALYNLKRRLGSGVEVEDTTRMTKWLD